MAELGSLYDTIILEDDPYRDIRYSGTDLPPIKAFDTTGHTVLANSFSKIFSPGSRLGYVLASEEITAKLFDAKTATNSHTSMLPQVICAEFFKRGYYPAHHRMICDLYRERRDVMIESIDTYFPKGTVRTFPDGGSSPGPGFPEASTPPTCWPNRWRLPTCGWPTWRGRDSSSRATAWGTTACGSASAGFLPRKSASGPSVWAALSAASWTRG